MRWQLGCRRRGKITKTTIFTKLKNTATKPAFHPYWYSIIFCAKECREIKQYNKNGVGEKGKMDKTSWFHKTYKWGRQICHLYWYDRFCAREYQEIKWEEKRMVLKNASKWLKYSTFALHGRFCVWEYSKIKWNGGKMTKFWCWRS